MAQLQIELTGVLTGTPGSASYFASGLQDLLPVSFCQVCAGKQNDVLSGLVSSAGSPFSVPFGTITKARVIVFKLLAGATMAVTITTGKGPATLPVSDELVLLVKNPGDEVTAITIDTGSQSVDLAYLVAGDIG